MVITWNCPQNKEGIMPKGIGYGSNVKDKASKSGKTAVKSAVKTVKKPVKKK
jgi:hypothetical protein